MFPLAAVAGVARAVTRPVGVRRGATYLVREGALERVRVHFHNELELRADHGGDVERREASGGGGGVAARARLVVVGSRERRDARRNPRESSRARNAREGARDPSEPPARGEGLTLIIRESTRGLDAFASGRAGEEADALAADMSSGKGDSRLPRILPATLDADGSGPSARANARRPSRSPSSASNAPRKTSRARDGPPARSGVATREPRALLSESVAGKSAVLRALRG